VHPIIRRCEFAPNWRISARMTLNVHRATRARGAETPRIAVNQPTGAYGWTPPVSGAIADCLTFAGQIIESGTISFPLAHARGQRPGETGSAAG
jgi:hypothetical protein